MRELNWREKEKIDCEFFKKLENKPIGIFSKFLFYV